MNKIIGIIIFIVIALGIYFLFHYYVYMRITKGLGLAGTWRNIVLAIIIIGGLSFILAQIAGRFTSIWLLSFIGSIWLGILAITFSIFILKDLLCLIFPQIVRTATIAGIGLAVVLSLFSIYNAAREIKIKTIEISSSKLSHEFDGFKIVQLSDLHLGILNDAKWLEKIVDATNKLAPDLIVITGDLMDEDIGSFSDILKQFESKYGVYAITGNHEYFPGIRKFNKLTRNSGIIVLNNSSATIADAIELIGINDPEAKRFGHNPPNIDKALENCDTTKPVILLFHRPTHFKEFVQKGVDIQLSGHTHFGQITPMGIIVFIIYGKYAYGLHKFKNSYIYTTSGTGTWGPPMRLFSRSEIVKFVLKCE